MNKNKTILLVGMSNCGKDSILNELVKKHNFVPLISTTSRPIRPSEIDGREYNFTTKNDFLNKAENGYFVETRTYFTTVNGLRDIYYYGLPKNQLEKTNKPTVLIVDKQGAEKFAEYVGEDNVVLIYLEVDKEIARQRNIKRGDYDEAEFERRFLADKKSIKGAENMAHVSINTDRQIEEILKDILECYNYYN